MLFKKIGTLLRFILNFVNNLITSFGKFGKSSYLSLLFLGIILLMVQALEQANTLLVDMIESDKFSLLCCFMVIAVFASVLSHYPRYIYYAEDINDSRDDHKWYAYKWFGYAIFIFSKIETNTYKQDYKAKFFRHSLGLIIFIIWHYYIYQTFYSKLYFSGLDVSMIRLVTIVISVMPAIVLIVLLDKMDVYQDKLLEIKSDAAINLVKSQKRQFVKRGLYTLFVFAALVLVVGFIILFTLNFSLYGYWLLQGFTFIIAILYIMFRVFRVYAKTINFNRYYFLSSSVGYLRYYFVFFVVVILFLIYSNIAVYYKWRLSNAMLILLANIFVIYYSIACLVKYFFMLAIFKTQKEDLDNNPYVTEKGYLNSSGVLKENWSNLVSLDKQQAFSIRRRLIASITTFAIVILCVVSFSSETQIHELQSYKTNINENVLDIETFKDSLRSRTDKPLFFVAAHGGGLKS